MKASKSMCIYAFDSLRKEIDSSFKQDPREPTEIPTSLESPLFVTWKKRDHGSEYDLRGCIGNLSGLPLRAGIGEYAVIAGTRDHRFMPISASELKQLRVTVSVLIDYEDGKDCYDWTVGTHGIIIKLINGQSAVFLPEVASEQGWDKETTLKHLIRKAGYHRSYVDCQSVIKS
ncbi:AMMECR1 like protein, partial [Aduncisulcus paluster]